MEIFSKSDNPNSAKAYFHLEDTSRHRFAYKHLISKNNWHAAITTLQNTIYSPYERPLTPWPVKGGYWHRWELGQVVKNSYKKKSPRVSNPLPLLAQEEASPVNGMWASDDKCSTKAGQVWYLTTAQSVVGKVYSLLVGVHNSSCLRPPFPWPGKGGWVIPTVAELYYNGNDNNRLYSCI